MDDVLDSDGMIKTIAGWLERFPIISVEDGLSEDDWEYWTKLRRPISALTLGDDLLCTNPSRIQRAIEVEACDALLRSVTLSARSGETEDTWAADLAVGWQADQFKNGSIRHSDRLAKYNRLLEIAEDTNCRFADWPQRT